MLQGESNISRPVVEAQRNAPLPLHELFRLAPAALYGPLSVGRDSVSTLPISLDRRFFISVTFGDNCIEHIYSKGKLGEFIQCIGGAETAPYIFVIAKRTWLSVEDNWQG
jgi:hypothetical protein